MSVDRLTRLPGPGPRRFGAETANASGSIIDFDADRADQVDVVFQMTGVFGCDTYNPETELWIEGDAVSTMQEPVELCAGESTAREHSHTFQAVEHERQGRITLLNSSDTEVDSVDITIRGTTVGGGDGGCDGDFDCNQDETCEAGECVPLNCGPNEVAQNHACVPVDDGGNGGNGGCQSDADCPSGQVCQNGTCVTPTQSGLFGLSQQELLLAGGGLAVGGVALFLSQRQNGGGRRRRRRR